MARMGTSHMAVKMQTAPMARLQETTTLVDVDLAASKARMVALPMLETHRTIEFKLVGSFRIDNDKYILIGIMFLTNLKLAN